MDWLKELAVVAFGFALGFVSQRYWNRKSQEREKKRQADDEIREDKRLLLKMREILLEIERMWKSSSPARPLINCMDELSQLSAEIRREENKTIKFDPWDFSSRYLTSARFGHCMIFSKLWFLYNKTKQGDIYESQNKSLT